MCAEPAGHRHDPANRNWQGEWRRTPGRVLGIGLIRAYQIVLSPFLGRSCRHLPTCSEFGYEAISRYGLLPGGWMTFWRVLKCNPLGTAGFDPVPARMDWRINRPRPPETGTGSPVASRDD